MAQLTIPDVSEFQGVIDWKKLVGGGYPAAIIRAHNGNRADSYFAANRSKAHANGIKALAMYQYVVANRDTAAQANELCDLVGALKSGEWLVCDLEVGTGDQSGRAHTWLKTVMSRLHDDGSAEELYSGESFYGSHNLASAGFKRIWIAAYRSTEPTVHHELWQFTDAKTFPGIAHACDASIFHGTVADLPAHVNKPAPTPPGTNPPPVHAPSYQPFPGTSWFSMGRKSKIVAAMHDRLVAVGCNHYQSSANKDTIGSGDKASYEAWQRHLGYTGSSASWPPGKSSWDALHVAKVV